MQQLAYSKNPKHKFLQKFTRKNAKIFNEKPDAVFTASYTLFEGVLKWFKETKRKIPKNIMIGTFDDHPLLDFLPFGVDSVKQNCKKMGKEAFGMILDALNGKKNIGNICIKPEIIKRNKHAKKFHSN